MSIRKYSEKLGLRFPTMSRAIELLEQRGGKYIVETGCTRMENDWGAGNSTPIFGEWAKEHGGSLVTVDNNARHLGVAKSLTLDYADCIDYQLADSVTFLSHFGEFYEFKIDLFYADSFDFPLVELMQLYASKPPDYEKAMKILKDLGDDELIKRHGDMILPPQEHCKREVLEALPHLHENSIILMDDSAMPGGGKPRLANLFLEQMGWYHLMSSQQELWVKEKP